MLSMLLDVVVSYVICAPGVGVGVLASAAPVRGGSMPVVYTVL